MTSKPSVEPSETRDRASIDMPADEFRAAGHWLVDAIADFFDTLPAQRVTAGESVDALAALIPSGGLPERGQPAESLLRELAPIFFAHSLHNGHPRFFGYITASAAPLGALGDLLAAAVNANCGLRQIAPAANEIERQVVAWLAELVGYPPSCGGLIVSGGNVANILGFIAARRAALGRDVRVDGVPAGPGRPRVYCAESTHTWIQKAADLSGIGTNAIRWIPTDDHRRLATDALERQIAEDRRRGDTPMLIVGTAGDVSTGAIDPLPEIAAIATRESIWFHVDGAYGAPAACLPEAPEALKALRLADSVALDPHKWLYVPIEAACTLVRDAESLRAAFGYRPPYYRLDDEADRGGIDYFEHGLQNTRGFKALKVWLCLRQMGRAGYVDQIRADIALAAYLFERAVAEPAIEAGTCELSIVTFRFCPDSTPDRPQDYLDTLNEHLLAELQRSGEAWVSNAVLGGHYFLRACIVNFRSRKSDVDALLALVVRLGTELDAAQSRR